MNALISEELNASLNAQIAHEKYNANLYLYVAGYLKNKGFDKLAKHFEGQHAEETEHALKIYNLLTDLNSPLRIEQIDEIKLEISSVMDIASAYLAREILTTNSLDGIKKQAVFENNPVVEEKMREMIAAQQHEYAEATDWLDHAEICGTDWFRVLVWNNTI